MHTYAANMPLHRLQHTKYAEYMHKIRRHIIIICTNMLICIKCAKNMHKICQNVTSTCEFAKYAENMQKICMSLGNGIFCVYMYSPLSPLCFVERSGNLNLDSEQSRPGHWQQTKLELWRVWPSPLAGRRCQEAGRLHRYGPPAARSVVTVMFLQIQIDTGELRGSHCSLS